METQAVSEPVDTGFSTTKKRILESLKRSGDWSLTELSGELSISKMATLKHLAVLEAANLVGPASYIKERIAAFEEAGVTSLNVTPVAEDPAAVVAQLQGFVS